MAANPENDAVSGRNAENSAVYGGLYWRVCCYFRQICTYKAGKQTAITRKRQCASRTDIWT
eukprot:2514785-Rhodomonas_salina.1